MATADNLNDSYLQGLHTYLLSFTKRTQPLVDVDEQQVLADTEFTKLWNEGQLSGWEEPNTDAQNGTDGVWCSACASFALLSQS